MRLSKACHSGEGDCRMATPPVPISPLFHRVLAVSTSRQAEPAQHEFASLGTLYNLFCQMIGTLIR